MRSVTTLVPITVMKGKDDDNNNSNHHHHHHHHRAGAAAIVTNTATTSDCHSSVRTFNEALPLLSGRVLRTLVGTVGVTLFDPLYIEALDDTHHDDTDTENDQDSGWNQGHNYTVAAWNETRSAVYRTSHTTCCSQTSTSRRKQHVHENADEAAAAAATTAMETRDVVDSSPPVSPNQQQQRQFYSLSRMENEGQRSLEEQDDTNDTNQDEENDDHSLPRTFLEPEHPFDLQECPRILNESSLAELRQALPDSLRHNKWERCFAIGRDGDSMISMLQRTAPYVYTILVGLDTHGHVVGGFCTESWSHTTSSGSSVSWLDASSTGGSLSPPQYQSQHNHQYHRAQQRGGYYGTGQSFLFASHPDIVPGLDAPRDPNKHFMIYKWTGDNDYCQIIKDGGSLGGSSSSSSSARHRGGDHLAMGGKGDFGLIVHDHFISGETGRCATFGNPPLVPSGHFDMVAFEVYGAVSLFSSSTICQSSSLLASTAHGGGSCPVLDGNGRNSSARTSNASSRTKSQSTSSLRSPIRLL